jgi:hypothetical protein
MKINITSVRQSLMIGGTITVYLNDVESAWIGNGQSATINAQPGDNKLLFKYGPRSKVIEFTSNSDVDVTLKWNRLSGGIDALCNGVDVTMR